MRNRVTSFFSMGPADNDHHPAIRAMIGVGVPLLILFAAGRTDLTVFASLGAFTAVYGRGEPHRQRLGSQSLAAILLVLAVALGLLLSSMDPEPYLVIGGTAAVAMVFYVLINLLQLKPSGPLFQVFAFSAVAMIPAPPFFEAMGVAVASALFSILIGVAGWLLPSHRTPWTAPKRRRLTPLERRAVTYEAFMHSTTVGFAGTIAATLGFGHGYWAMIASVVPMVGATTSHRVERGLHRIAGTFAGLVIAWILFALPLSTWQMVATVIFLQFFVELLVTRQYALAQMFVTPLALLMNRMATVASPTSLIIDRGVETVIGATTGIALVLFLHFMSAGPDRATPVVSGIVADPGEGVVD